MRRGKLPIVFEDDDLVVVNKPAGLLTVPLERRSGAPSVADQLADYLRSRHLRPFVVHRIDEDTSGLVVFAKHPRAGVALAGQFKRREPRRVYRTVVYGHPVPPEGTWRDRIVWDEKARIQKRARAADAAALDAESQYRVLESFRGAAFLEVRLVTGRRNQIRIQAALHGHPLVGEKRYVERAVRVKPIRFERYALHAFQLGFTHPRDGRPLEFEAPIPADLAALLTRLRRPA